MKAWLATGAMVAAVLIAVVPFLSLIGVGVHRGAAAWAVSGSATLLVFGPALLAGAVTLPRRRNAVIAGALAVWSVVVFQLLLPIYFPGERAGAFRGGLAVLGLGADMGDLPDTLSGQFPDEPQLSRPLAPVAEAAELSELPPPLDEEALALPYEGDGRRMAVPVVFRHEGVEHEVVMMFDTGATYTTLARRDLDALGIEVTDDAPVIELHTANGVRTAQLVLIDEVWLGNLPVRHVAIATCEACATSDTAGLLGLNVSGGFNLQIDADRREVMFRPRAVFDRQLDVKLFSEMAATYERLPGDRVEVQVTVSNPTPHSIERIDAQVSCAEGSWTVAVGPVPAGESRSERRALPSHARCDSYDLAMDEAHW